MKEDVNNYYVARDKNNKLHKFHSKPNRKSTYWYPSIEDTFIYEDYIVEIDGTLYPLLSWEDEPIKMM